MPRIVVTTVIAAFAFVLTACSNGTSVGGSTNNDLASNGKFTLSSASTATVTEGAGQSSVQITIDREPGHTLPISLSAQGATAIDSKNLDVQLQSSQLSGANSTTNLLVQLSIADAPILAGQRQIRVTANDGSNAPVSAVVTVNVQPTNLPDVYLLAGQSNMVGFSEDFAKQSGAGQIDAPNSRIKQLNVTGNDGFKFTNPSDFTNESQIAWPDLLITEAVDPLHNGYDLNINGKQGSRVGLGLSFAKQMLPSTTADIVLVPAAWSDTGFCKRDTNLFPGLGWLATANSNADYSGTLLHDRALARLNLTLKETGGIFRGILWHQGEADTGSMTCANEYSANLKAFAESIRSKAIADARGSSARGPNANIPLVVGTMSKGTEAFWDTKIIVDAAHRSVASNITSADVVIADDLIPPAYECGEGSCIHFGARAYREMGVRYAQRLQALQAQ